MSPIRVFVVDDHTLIRQGIVGLLESQPDIEVVGQAGNGREAVATFAAMSPDVVLMDIAMPGISGLTATREMKERRPDVRVLILTIHDREDYLFQALRAGASGYVLKERRPDVRVLILTIHDREDYLFQALRAGASGYVLKGADVQDLLAAVRTAYRGEIYLYPSVTSTLVADYLRRARGGEDRAIYDGLSDREREILHLIAQGKTGPEIAAELFLSPHTVQSHRDHIMAKLDLHSKAALIKYAVAKGLIEL